MTVTSRRRALAIVIAAGFAAIAALIVGATTLSSPSPVAPDPATPASGPAAVPFAMFDGSTATLADYRGRPVVVNFWASWCPSCVAEMSAAFRPVQEAIGDEVAFLGMNLQDERSRASELVEETGVLFDLAEDPDGDLYVELGGLGMPFTVFIDADGEIVERHNGPLSASQLREMIDALLLGA